MALSRGNETITFLLVMLVTSFIGAFVSNTGTVALMMPIIMSIAAGSGMHRRVSSCRSPLPEVWVECSPSSVRRPTWLSMKY